MSIQRYDEDSTEHGFNSYITPSTVWLYYDRRHVEATTDSGTVYASGRFHTGSVEHKLVAGVDAMRRVDRAEDAYVDDVAVFDLLNPEYFPRPISTYGPFIAETWGGDQRTLGLFIQDQLTFGQIDVLAGVRSTTYRQTYTYNGTSHEKDSAVTPRLSVVYRLTEDSSVYGTWLTGFEPNYGYSPTDGGPFGPTDSQLFEVGYKQMAFDRRMLLTAAAYQLTNDDVVVWDDATSLYRQRGQEQAHGIELEAVGKLGEDLSIISNYAYNRAKVTKDLDPANVGKTKENAPKHAATLAYASAEAQPDDEAFVPATSTLATRWSCSVPPATPSAGTASVWLRCQRRDGSAVYAAWPIDAPRR